MLKNVGVDTGFGFGLMKCADKEIKLASYIHKIREEEAKTISSTIRAEEVLSGKKVVVKIYGEVKENGETEAPAYFAVGDFVTKIKPEATRYVTLKRVGDKKHLAQLLTLIGLAFETQECKVNLGMGLPTVLRHQTEDTKKWLKNKFKISFLYNGGELLRDIVVENVEVIGQAVAPILTLDDDLLPKNILSIDLGHNTNDFCLWQDGIMPENYRQASQGFRKYYTVMEEKLLKEYKDKAQRFSETRLQTAIETGKVTFRNEVSNVENLQKEIFEDYAEELRESITSNYEDVLDIVDVILLSGGVIENDKFYLILEEALKDLNIKLTRPAMAQWNVVKGIYNRVAYKYKDDFSSK